jgi:hypothetical protein
MLLCSNREVETDHIDVPEQKLMVNILGRAFRDLLEHDENLVEEALGWFYKKEDEAIYEIFSFSGICFHLGFDRKSFLKAIENQVLPQIVATKNIDVSKASEKYLDNVDKSLHMEFVTRFRGRKW